MYSISPIVMSSHSLPPGCSIRKARYRDLPQLVLQLFESDSLNEYIQLTNSLLFILFIITFAGYKIGFNLAKDSYRNTDTSFFVEIRFLENVLYNSESNIFYKYETDYRLIIENISTYVGNFFGIFFLLVAIIIIGTLWLRSLYLQTWIVEKNNQVIASGRFNINIFRLDMLYVKPQYRRQGVASYFIKYIQKYFNKPIFLISNPKLVRFFEHIGFIKAVGNQQQFAWGKARNKVPMYLPEESIELTATKTRILFKQSIGKSLIRPALKKDIDQIQQLQFFNETMDYFFPYGINFVWTNQLIFWGSRVLFWQFLFINYETIDLSFSNKSYHVLISLFYSNILFGLIGIILLGLIEYNKNQKLQNYQLFTLFEYDNQVIGYARFDKKRKYFTIYHVYLPTSLQPELITYFIQKITDLTVQPMFIACTKQEAKLYRKIGFLQIDVDKLPKNLRLGGWFNELLGGKNLIYISKK